MRNLIIANVETLSHDAYGYSYSFSSDGQPSSLISLGASCPQTGRPWPLAPLWIRHRRQCTGTGKYRPRL